MRILFIVQCEMTRYTIRWNVIIIYTRTSRSLNTGRVFKKLFKDGRCSYYIVRTCVNYETCSVCVCCAYMAGIYMADGLFFLPLILNVSLYMYISGVKVHAATTHTRARDKA